jgi:hypothetical protein
MIRTDRAFGEKTNILCAWGLTVAVGCCSCIPALACPGPSFERTIIFNHIPTDIDAPVIAEVTIIDMKPADIHDLSNLTGMAVMNARVESVIKGQIGERLKIVTPLSDCSNGFGIGSHGFVAGELRSDPSGTFELVAISENVRKANARPR